MRRAKAQSFLSGNSDGVGPFGLTFGSIANHGGALTVSGWILSGNAASLESGGIANLGMLTVSGSTIYGNSATYGGGIYNVVFATLKVATTASCPATPPPTAAASTTSARPPPGQHPVR